MRKLEVLIYTTMELWVLGVRKTKYPKVPVQKTAHKEKITGTVDHAIADKLREIMPLHYYNYSAVINDVLKAGLEHLGYELEA